MIDDLDRMVRVREHRKRLALQRMLADRRAAAASAEAARAAELRLQHGVAEKALHWSATAGALDGRACRVERLRAAASWSGALDRRIAQLSTVRQRADSDAARGHATLAASGAAHAIAARGVEKAEQLRDRVQAIERRVDESRRDAEADELAAQRRAAARPVR